MRWVCRVLILFGLVILSYSFVVYLDTALYQAHLSQSLDDKLDKRLPVARADGVSRTEHPERSQPPERPQPLPVADGALIGRIEVPRIGISVMVLEGVETQTLDRAAGHVPGTPLPGQRGNSAIAGHRDSFFYKLSGIAKNDVIVVTTEHGVYRYKVLSTEVVDPDEMRVLEPGTHDSLTLITCYPFHFIGPAPHRFIVHSQLV